MTIFFTASLYGKPKYQREYDQILEILRELPIDVIGTEAGNYLNVYSDEEQQKLRQKHMLKYEAIRKGIFSADASIIEISNPDFQLGHEATLAVQAKKHVLCLSCEHYDQIKIASPYFHLERYSKFTLRKIITDFLELVNTDRLSERFNMFLSARQLQYLQWRASETGSNASEYLRGLLEADMR